METVKEKIRAMLMQAGAEAVGFARAGEVDRQAADRYARWIERGGHGELHYMERHGELRLDPRRLLPGCHTIVSAAWLYNPPCLRDASLPYLARYAYSRDYHKALRSVLRPLTRQIEARYGCATRICIDSAPVMERYWAVKSGVGFCGRNGLLIVPGAGSRVFLTELLLTLELPPDTPCTLSCAGCGECVRACPAAALCGDGTTDCRRCISALTIEVPGSAVSLPQATLAGCDVCQDVCPHNREQRVGSVEALSTLDKLLNVSGDELEKLTPVEFEARYAGTPLMRVGLRGLLDNLAVPLSPPCCRE